MMTETVCNVDAIYDVSDTCLFLFFFFFSSRRRHTRCGRDWSSDVCSSDLDNSPRYARAATTWARTPTDSVGSTMGAKRGEWLAGLLSDSGSAPPSNQ